MVLDLVGVGRPIAEAAKAMGTERPSIYVLAIFAKLQVADRTQAILRARDTGLGHHYQPAQALAGRTHDTLVAQGCVQAPLCEGAAQRATPNGGDRRGHFSSSKPL
jgi:hypothetical protein